MAMDKSPIQFDDLPLKPSISIHFLGFGLFGDTGGYTYEIP